MNMSRSIALLLVLLLGYAPSHLLAGQDADALSACMADNSTGKERKALARWVFLAMAQHPEIESLSSATEADRSGSQKEMAGLVTRLLTVQCVEQLKRVVKNEGQAGMGASFKVLGELAMRELMTDQKVSTAMTGYVLYLDKELFERLFSAK